MAYPQTAQAIPVAIPVRGMNTKDPLAAMEQDFAPWILNFEPEPQYLRLRNGYVIHSDLSAVADAVFAVAAYGGEDLFAYCYKAGSNDFIVNVSYPDYETGKSYAESEMVRGKSTNRLYICETPITTSTSEPTGSTPGAPITDGDGVWTYVSSATVKSLSDDGSGVLGLNAAFNGRLCFLGTTDPADLGTVYDGSSWAAFGFTSGGLTIPAVAAANYRGRVYLVRNKYLYYSAIAAVTGACTAVDLSSILEMPGTGIVWIGTLTDSTNKPTESMLAFGTDRGEVFVYAENSPESPDWAMVAKLKIPPVLNYQPILEINNDLWVATTIGIVSLRALLQGGEDSVDAALVTRAISPYWKSLVEQKVLESKNISYPWPAYGVGCTLGFWPEQNKVYVALHSFISATGAYTGGSSDPCTVLVYNLFSQAWTIHQAAGTLYSVQDLTYFKDSIYLAAKNYVLTVGSGYKDSVIQPTATGYAAIPYALHSAYSNFGSPQKFKHVVGVEPLIKTDFTGSDVTLKTTVDFGRRTSSPSSVALLDGHQAPFYPAGNQGNWIQYRIEGNTTQTSTDGLELYSVGVAIK